MSLHGSIKLCQENLLKTCFTGKQESYPMPLADSDKRIELPQASITCHDKKIICEIDALILYR